MDGDDSDEKYPFNSKFQMRQVRLEKYVSQENYTASSIPITIPFARNVILYFVGRRPIRNLSQVLHHTRVPVPSHSSAIEDAVDVITILPIMGSLLQSNTLIRC